MLKQFYTESGMDSYADSGELNFTEFLMHGIYKYAAAVAAAMFLVPVAQADDAQTLKDSIFKIKGFKADYTQEVASQAGKVLQSGSGSIEMLRPNLFRMDIKEPGEAMLLADGSSIYNYDEMLEQVTIYRQDNTVSSSPFMLLVSQDQALWDSYDVKKINSSSYEITPKAGKGGLTGSFKIDFGSGYAIKSFVITETDGRTNTYVFTPRKDDDGVPDAADFKYSIPDGLTVDDQRTK